MKTPLLWRKNLRRNRGFALIVTLTLMVLLTIIALGLLSLSTVSLRQSSKENSVSTAKANARLALMLAIGELQAAAGPDTRVTARADILNENNPPILGVWKSWEGTDHESNGRPIAPDYSAKTESAQRGSGRFVRWMVSGDPEKLTRPNDVPDVDEKKGRIELIGDNTVGRGSEQRKYKVALDPVLVNNSSNKGAYAWWVGGENQKARLPEAETNSSGAASWASKMQSHSNTDPKPFGLDPILRDAEAASKTVTLKQIDLIGQPSSKPPSQQHFFDISTVSKGLLTNTATGGWRKDLSLFTEKYDDLPNSNLPLFRLTPSEDSSQGRASVSQPLANNSLLYPWASYRGGATPAEKAGAVASWANLADYTQMYRKLGSSNSFSYPQTSIAAYGNAGTYLHTVKPMPIVARLQWVCSYNVDSAGRIQFLMNPVVTLWNPYNVSLNTGRMVFTLSKKTTFPIKIKCGINFETGGLVEHPDFRLLGLGPIGPGPDGAPALGGGHMPEFYIKEVGTILPGQSKAFSANSNALTSVSIESTPGFRSNQGHFFQITFLLPDNGGASAYRQSYTGGFINVDKYKNARTIYTTIKTDSLIPSGDLAGQFGVRLVVREDGGGVGNNAATAQRKDGDDANEMVYQMMLPSSAANSKEIGLPPVDVAELTASKNSYPLASLAFGLRLIDNLYEPGQTHFGGKGFVQGSPVAGFADQSIGSGGQQRINGAYDYNLIVHPGNSDVVPNANGANGYLLTGITAATGLTRAIAADIPVKPLASLAELQGWDLRFGNPSPPFAYNLIGNSDASPMIASSSVFLGNGSASDMQFDDSYCANHVLFDDWFFSSINQGNAESFGSSGSLQDNFQNFVSNKLPLVNRAYKPNGEDMAKAQGGGSDLYNTFVEANDSWRKVASRIEVEGMFNVNSTSIAAWRALLGHARGQVVPHYDGNGNVVTSSQTDYPVTRYAIAGDETANSDSQGASRDGRANTTRYTGSRVFTDNILDELAEKIVDQVRQRGPFLSLSEFVNRQLSSNKDLALAGAIQTALNEMETAINGGIDASRASYDAQTTDYKFPEAAAGSLAYGMPGWVRQADILRPIAPILSARDDTFTIRTYGDSRDATGKILATAYCEAVVTRTRNYCDPSDSSDYVDPPRSATNVLYGRKLEIISFRWLSKSEI